MQWKSSKMCMCCGKKLSICCKQAIEARDSDIKLEYMGQSRPRAHKFSESVFDSEFTMMALLLALLISVVVADDLVTVHVRIDSGNNCHILPSFLVRRVSLPFRALASASENSFPLQSSPTRTTT